MRVSIRPCGVSGIAHLRERYRSEARCQIVRDSILPRGLADAYAILDGDDPIGYAGIWNKYTPGRLMEFFVVPSSRRDADAIFVDLVRFTSAREAEAQTNLPFQHRLVRAYTTAQEIENLLFGDGPDFPLERPDLIVRPRASQDVGPEGDWVVERRGRVVGAGGLMHHYNPPYADVYVEVVPEARGDGVGSFLVQELRRAARASGRIPAARCDPANRASRGALLRGGFREVGSIVAGALAGSVDAR